MLVAAVQVTEGARSCRRAPPPPPPPPPPGRTHRCACGRHCGLGLRHHQVSNEELADVVLEIRVVCRATGGSSSRVGVASSVQGGWGRFPRLAQAAPGPAPRAAALAGCADGVTNPQGHPPKMTRSLRGMGAEPWRRSAPAGDASPASPPPAPAAAAPSPGSMPALPGVVRWGGWSAGRFLVAASLLAWVMLRSAAEEPPPNTEDRTPAASPAAPRSMRRPGCRAAALASRHATSTNAACTTRDPMVACNAARRVPRCGRALTHWAVLAGVGCGGCLDARLFMISAGACARLASRWGARAATLGPVLGRAQRRWTAWGRVGAFADDS